MARSYRRFSSAQPQSIPPEELDNLKDEVYQKIEDGFNEGEIIEFISDFMLKYVKDPDDASNAAEKLYDKIIGKNSRYTKEGVMKEGIFYKYLERVRSINEGSYDDFLMNYSNELRQAIKLLPLIGEALNTATDEQFDRAEQEMSKYDTNVDQTIQHWATLMVHSPRAIGTQEIANFAIRNQDQYGTEPQMVLFAINDMARALGVNTFSDDEEEF